MGAWEEWSFDSPGELAAVLDLLPLAALVLSADGSAVAANEEWTLLFPPPAGAWRGEGWLGAVAPADRDPLLSLLAGAAAAGKPGSADFRLAGSGGGRPSRWWWRPAAPGQLVVCVADLTGSSVDVDVDVAVGLVHRMFGIGLVLESAAGLAGGPVSHRLQRAIGELDAVIRDIRAALFSVPAPSRAVDDGTW